MKNFDEKLSALLVSKRHANRKAWEPSSKDSLAMLLKHVYQQVMVPVHLALTEQPDFNSSDLTLDTTLGAEDTEGDGLKDRPMATLIVRRRLKIVFEYWLSFDGDTKDEDASLWRKIDFDSTFPKLDFNNPPVNYFDSDLNVLNKKQKSVEQHAYFPTFDMNEAVRLVQDDLYLVFKALL